MTGRRVHVSVRVGLQGTSWPSPDLIRGSVPAIHVWETQRRKGVDARPKAGHDGRSEDVDARLKAGHDRGGKTWNARLEAGQARLPSPYSHSIVPGGFEVMS